MKEDFYGQEPTERLTRDVVSSWLWGAATICGLVLVLGLTLTTLSGCGASGHRWGSFGTSG